MIGVYLVSVSLGLYLFVDSSISVLLVSCVMWSGAPDSLDLLLSHPAIALAYNMRINHTHIYPLLNIKHYIVIIVIIVIIIIIIIIITIIIIIIIITIVIIIIIITIVIIIIIITIIFIIIIITIIFIYSLQILVV